MVRDAEVSEQLRRILESPAFIASARSRQFLQFCVDRTIRGDPSQLKETTIAVEVFLRAADYDPKIDPIVRVHARRVRQKLDLYYRNFGADDPIKIGLPKGGYVAQILRTLPTRKTDFSDWADPQPGLDSEGAAPASLSIAGISTAAPAIPAANSNGELRRVAVVAFILLALLGTAVAWISRTPPHSQTATIGPLKPVDLGTDQAADFDWSPDGTQLAFTQTQKDRTTRIYIRKFPGGARPVPLTDHGENDESHPVWSPDGHEIAFARRIDLSHIEIVRHNLVTNKELLVGRFLNRLPLYRDSPALDWSPDGRYMVTAEQTGTGNPVRLVLVSLATGERTALTSPPTSSTGDIEARFSPDSQWVAFRRGGLGDLYLVSIRGEQLQPAVRLTVDNLGVRGIAWVNDGQSILFGTKNPKTSTFGLAEISRSGGVPQPLGPPDFDAIGPAVSATGTLALEHREIVADLVEHSLAQPHDRVLVESDSNNASPMYSPDGRLLAYTSNRSGCMELWLAEDGKPEPRQITHFQCSGILLMPSWAPDGRSIAFSLRENAATNLFLYDVPALTLRQITATHNRDISPVYSGDGRYLYYSSNDDGTSRIWRVRTDGSSHAEPMFVEAVTGFEPSPDGRWLYFLRDGDDLTLLRKNLEDGAIEEVFHVAGRPTFLNSFEFAGDRIFLPVSQSDPTSSDVYEIDPATRHGRVVMHLKDLAPYSESGNPGFSVSADGSRLVAAHTQRYETTLYTTRIAK